ncbi:MAG: hypothetical protein E7224_06095 [Clostridiales bacterium]|nr:hypothetical protein [Clostridiales bacterium]
MKKKSLLFFCVICLLIVPLTACGAEEPAPEEEKSFSEQVMDQVWLCLESSLEDFDSSFSFFIEDPEDIYLHQVLYGSFTASKKKEFIAQVKMSDPPAGSGLDPTMAFVFDEATMEVLCHEEFYSDFVTFTKLPLLGKREAVVFSGSTIQQGLTNQYIWVYDLSGCSWNEIPSGLPEFDTNTRFYLRSTGLSILKLSTGEEVFVNWDPKEAQFYIWK